jgi:CrcB protein
MSTQVLLVALGGGMGALCRYGLSALAVRIVGVGFPAGTLMANLMGCFMIGIALALIEHHNLLDQAHRLFFMTGFLGALTTFSTFALESVMLARSGAWLSAGLNLAINNAAGITLVLVGIWIGRRL